MSNGDSSSKYRNGWWVTTLLITFILTAVATGSVERWVRPDRRTDQEIRELARDEMQLIERDLAYIREQIAILRTDVKDLKKAEQD